MLRTKIECCPCTLSAAHTGYSSLGLRRMFDGRRVKHILPFDPPSESETTREMFRQNVTHLSISGTQPKFSVVLEKNKLRLTREGERGMYILKPIPGQAFLENESEAPANEHLTMQIARQAFDIPTAECALVFFKNGEPAYLTRRFDRTPDGQKISQEDFASLAGRTKDNAGDSFKTSGSYLTIAMLIRKFLPAHIVETERFFERVLFNYLFCNGDAHLKNFSVTQTPQRDYLLTPAYDLLNTRLHLPADTAFAMEDGLFPDMMNTTSYSALGFAAYDDFFEFGQLAGIREDRMVKILKYYRSYNPDVHELVQCSFLSEEAKDKYLYYYHDRLRALNNSHSGKI